VLGYLKEALLDAISILNFGTVVSEYRPCKTHYSKKSPVVFTLSKLEA
jgi:beta-lactam-binding protein with PASTA domain